MKKILITGNSGYIGSHLTKLLKADYEVYGLDLKDPQEPVTEHYKVDIRGDFASDNNDVFDAVIHLAALVNVGESEKFPVPYYDTNLGGTLNVLGNIKTKNFIFASTGAAEGCSSTYGISKRAAEDCVRNICETYNVPYTIFRFYNVIGTDGYKPTNPDGLMSKLMQATETGEFTIFGTDYDESWDGTCVRDYVHVMEVCEALKDAIETPSNSIECLGHGVGYTVKEIVDLYCTVNDVDFLVKSGPRRKGDLPSSVLENVSPYMKNLYKIEELLKVDNK
jgi:UDP-glucose 4-epimerase